MYNGREAEVRNIPAFFFKSFSVTYLDFCGDHMLSYLLFARKVSGFYFLVINYLGSNSTLFDEIKKWSLHLKKTVFLGRELYCCHLKIARYNKFSALSVTYVQVCKQQQKLRFFVCCEKFLSSLTIFCYLRFLAVLCHVNQFTFLMFMIT